MTERVTIDALARINVALTTETERNILRSMAMGRGDRRTGKGKRFRGSYGKSRPQKKKK
ncbi:MAG: 30S ribosomal protein THX [Candidatus Dadabacteria bacterium]|nr:MAG: 30S ribosomal protein THX [Candidatus Dadabacteria bacterium]